MKIDFTDDGNGTLEGDEEELSHVYSQGIAYMLLKGLFNMDDNDATAAFKTYAELHLKIDRPVVGEVGDEWAYWTPEHVNETPKSEHDKEDMLRTWETFVKGGDIK